MSLIYIGQQITIYFGFLFLITGVIGNGINIFVFSSIRNYRVTPCTFYFLITSIYNIIYITINLTSRIIMSGYGFDLTRTSLTWCKLRQFIPASIVLISLNCSCLATIDQYLVTSQKVNVRRLSNIKSSYWIVFIVSIIWFVHGIPFLIFYDISPITNTCVNTNYGYSIYYSIYVIVLISAIPCIVMSIFGYLAYHNIQLTRVLVQQQADRQLLRMVLVQIILVSISFVPFGSYSAYGLITLNVSKNTNRLTDEGFAVTIFTMMTYIYFVGNFYTFLLSSSRFRRATKDRILFRFRGNHVSAIEMRNNEAVILDKGTRNRSVIF